MENHQFLLWVQKGKEQVSAGKQRIIEQQVAAHFGELKRDFDSGALNEDIIENIDETHFVIDFYNGRTFGFVGEKQIKYADVVSGGEGIMMVVRLSSGPGARILPMMIIFTNQESSHPIRGVPDSTLGACYRSGPKGEMTNRTFHDYLGEWRAMMSDGHGRRNLFSSTTARLT
uniref:Predicted protein putative n=1 Tax=Albugo laibachii Nc14 TaxID=890382 RepID=F0W9T6_9STRA|nr:predicted protein putative [Albugo laibachii Nc14]|eukprot:CCA17904.1 predicted protein putative [Albugo laibachii Nc14]